MLFLWRQETRISHTCIHPALFYHCFPFNFCCFFFHFGYCCCLSSSSSSYSHTFFYIPMSWWLRDCLIWKINTILDAKTLLLKVWRAKETKKEHSKRKININGKRWCQEIRLHLQFKILNNKRNSYFLVCWKKLILKCK